MRDDLPQRVEASFSIVIETGLSLSLDLLEVLPMQKLKLACMACQ